MTKTLVFLLALATTCRAGLSANEGSDKWEVSGTVSYDGRPLKGVFVIGTGPERVRGVPTDGHGAFVLTGKTAGQYSIGVVEREGIPDAGTRVVNVSVGMRIQHVDFTILKGGVISGRVFNKQRQPVSGIHVQAMARIVMRNGVLLKNRGDAITDDRGTYRLSHLADGFYVITASPRLSQPGPRRAGDSPRLASYSMVTFYPSGQTLGGALSVEVRSGQEQVGIDVLAEKLPSSCLAFQFAAPVRLESDFKLHLDVKPVLGSLAFLSSDYERDPLNLGTDYEMCGLTPGEYRIEAAATRVVSSAGRNTLEVAGYATDTVTIGNKELDLGAITLQPGIDVAGKVVAQRGGSEEGQFAPGNLQVRLQRNGFPIVMARYLEAAVQPAGQFTIKDVLPDAYELQVRNLPKGYYLLKASQLGKDVTKGELYPGRGAIDIVLAYGGGTLRGKVQGEQPESVVRGALVLLIPKNGEPPITTRADQDGRYEFESSLPPGEYQLAAVLGLYEGEQNDPGLASRFRFNGTDVTLQSQQTVNLDLKAQTVR